MPEGLTTTSRSLGLRAVESAFDPGCGRATRSRARPCWRSPPRRPRARSTASPIRRRARPAWGLGGLVLVTSHGFKDPGCGRATRSRARPCWRSPPRRPRARSTASPIRPNARSPSRTTTAPASCSPERCAPTPTAGASRSAQAPASALARLHRQGDPCRRRHRTPDRLREQRPPRHHARRSVARLRQPLGRQGRRHVVAAQVGDVADHSEPVANRAWVPRRAHNNCRQSPPPARNCNRRCAGCGQNFSAMSSPLK